MMFKIKVLHDLDLRWLHNKIKIRLDKIMHEMHVVMIIGFKPFWYRM